jgi:aryl-alcohol dehydrogenase-like predicted oxidoreductase/enamine deaminase RidA (YjgF/YER057c/UK114 family)
VAPKQTQVRGVPIRRLITGLWQMADQERDGKAFDLDHAAEALVAYARAGFDTFDMADHYGSAEIVAGMAHKFMSQAGEKPPTILTKWCPAPGPMDAGTVRQGVETALERLSMDKIDIMQFHWWRYEDARYLDALHELAHLRQEGLIGAIGLTNFDAGHLDLIARSGIEIATNQVSFSLIDRRAAGDLSKVATQHGVGLLAYGTLCGGFLSDRYVDADDPELADWSRMKYRRFIAQSGGWPPYQNLLSTLARVAEKHGISVSNVATRWVLDHDAVAAIIVGARLGENEHRADNLNLFSFEFDDNDHAEIDEAIAGLEQIPGDCGDEYRRPPFLTASGDLSHHLNALPPIFETTPSTSRPDRQWAKSGSIWEDAAGFSRAIRTGNRILVSGTTATDPDGNCVCPGDAGAQAQYILDKILAAVTSLGGAREDIIRTRIYMSDTAQWEAVSIAHRRAFGQVLPANTLIGIGSLIGDGYLVEIEAEAEVHEGATHGSD